MNANNYEPHGAEMLKGAALNQATFAMGHDFGDQIQNARSCKFKPPILRTERIRLEID